MKPLLFILGWVLSLSSGISQNSDGDSIPKGKNRSMKAHEINVALQETFVVGLLVPGQNTEIDSANRMLLKEKHLDFIKMLKAANKLVGSGPLFSSLQPHHRGLYIFNTQQISEAQAWMDQDVAVQTGWIQIEYYIWKTRDYAKPDNAFFQNIEDKEMRPEIFLLAIFFVIIIVFIIRTFRNKDTI